MPQLDGLKALASIRATGDTTPAVLISGQLSEDLETRLDPHTTLCRKPFQLGELARVVASCIESNAETEAVL